MTESLEKVPYKQWQSPLSLEEVFSHAGKPSFLELKNGSLYWMESNPEIGGAVQLKCRQPTAEIYTLTTPKLNVKTRVNEYGGKAFCIGQDAIYFCNDSDQRIYRLALNRDFYADTVLDDHDTEFEDSIEESFGEVFDENAPIDQAQPITPDDGRMYSDLCLSKDGKWLFFVMETPDIRENKTQIGVLSTQVGVNQPRVLATGCDFYASLVLSDDNKKLAWIEWRHPSMPWDETHVVTGCLSTYDDDPARTPYLDKICNSLDAMISGIGLGATISHLAFEALSDEVSDEEKNQRLFMVVDWPNQDIGETRNFAQLYCWNGQTLFEVTQGCNEYSYPHWIFGNHRYAFLERDKILAIATNQAGDELHLIDLQQEKIIRLADKFTKFSGICAENNVAYVIGETQEGSAQVLRFCDMKVAASPSKEVLSPANTSCAETLSIASPVENETHINNHAFFYAPKNARYSSSIDGMLPPLVVMVHGGPTARATSEFDVQKQFWTTSGFAVLDVNHRGSTGYGRNYRDQLIGQWGEVEAQDIKLSIEQVIKQGLVNPDQIFIRGKSAGGYSVQRALTLYPELFAGGASYYGIGDLATLASITHKFESHYCDQLLGEAYDKEKSKQPDSIYFKRSPIHKMSEIKSPMILFQGLDDKVVPPELSQQVANALDANKVQYEYYTYPGEGHGFVGMNAKVDSLTKELLFYRKLMSD